MNNFVIYNSVSIDILYVLEKLYLYLILFLLIIFFFWIKNYDMLKNIMFK